MGFNANIQMHFFCNRFLPCIIEIELPFLTHMFLALMLISLLIFKIGISLLLLLLLLLLLVLTKLNASFSRDCCQSYIIREQWVNVVHFKCEIINQLQWWLKPLHDMPQFTSNDI